MSTSMAEKALEKRVSTFRGHKIIWDGTCWLYEDNLKPIPAGGGENRPCKKCGSDKWSGDGHVDECLGLLPGVDNACCGHGDPEASYIRFTNGVVIRGFDIVEYTERWKK